MVFDAQEQRESLATAILVSMGGTWYLSKGRALKHADAAIAAGFSRPVRLTSEAQVAQLPQGAVIERLVPGFGPQFLVKREALWHSIDGGEPLAAAALGGPGVTLTLRRT